MYTVNKHLRLTLYLPGIAAILTVLLVLPARQVFAVQDGPNLIKNGGFEDGFTEIEVADGWGHFQTDNAGIGFHDDMWDLTVYEGKHSQMIELADATSEDACAGIFQTVTVSPGQEYEFSLKGIVRSDEGSSARSNSGYYLEYAIDLSGNQDWQRVANWVELPWGEQPRTGPTFTMNLTEINFTATGDTVTLFIRARKRWSDQHEGNFNIDDVRLVPIVPGRSPATGTFGSYHSHVSLDAPDGDPLNALFVDDDGKVGIGTTNPSEALEINGTVKASLFQGDGSGLTGTTKWSDSERGIYYDAGNVGVGTTDPQSELDVRGTTSTEVLEITGGADLAERFEIAGTDTIRPGMVVAIDPDHVGKLRVAEDAYDSTVAGVVSGADGIRPGLIMWQDGTTGERGHLVSLTGRVYVWADATYGPIQPGDLLTTSETPGHAMKVTDHGLAQGAILGKAMSSLDEGQELILMLVALQ